jgi:hypothetical protein
VILVYVAGPYRADTDWGVEMNIQSARAAGAELAKNGFFPVIPHANTAHFGGLQPEQFFVQGDLQMMLACAAVLVQGAWGTSAGTRQEIASAERAQIPVFYSLVRLVEYFAETGRVPHP